MPGTLGQSETILRWGMPQMSVRSIEDVLMSRRPSFTAEEWIELLEAQLRSMKPHLKHMVLEPLNNVAVLRYNPTMEDPHYLQTKSVSDQASSSVLHDALRMLGHGVSTNALTFVGNRDTREQVVPIGEHGVCRLLCILRNGKLALVEVTFLVRRHAERGYMEDCTSINVLPTTFKDILELMSLEPQELLSWMHEIISDFCADREDLLRVARELKEESDLLQRLCSYVPSHRVE